MKRYRIPLVVLVLLMAISAWLLLSRRSGTYRPATVQFAINDTSLIQSIEIEDPGGRVLLLKENGTWTVGDGMPVRQDRMKGMLILLSRLEVLSPVSRSRAALVSKQLQEYGKQVFIVLGRGDTREYLVFFDTTGTGTTYMMMKDADTPFRMGVRGYRRKDLASLYMTDERYWRDNLLLYFLPDQIDRISLRNNLDPEKTFHLARSEDGIFEISTGILPGQWSQPDKASLNQYLAYCYRVRFIDYADLPPYRSMPYQFKNDPDYVLEVSPVEGRKKTIKLYPVFTIDEAGNKKMDLNILYAGVDNWDGMVVLKYLEIDPLLKDPGYFQGR